MNRRGWLAALAAGVMVMSLLGCGQGEDVIAVIPKGTTHEFWKSVHAGAQRAEKELGVKIIWKGPLKEDDKQEQIKVVEDFVSRRVKGIVLAPLDDTALQRPVATSVRSGIPVVIIDSDLKGQDFISFVATNNFEAGRIGGKELVRLIGGQGKVIMLRYQEGSASTMNREAGFLKAIEEHNAQAKKDGKPGVEVVRSDQYAGATSESAMQASERLLAPLKAEKDGKATLIVDGVFCPNESSAFGMLRALQTARVAGNVRFVGFDASDGLYQALKKGEIDALVLQNPNHMGYMGVKTMVQHLKGEKVEKSIDTGVGLATRENYKEQKVKDLLKANLGDAFKD